MSDVKLPPTGPFQPATATPSRFKALFWGQSGSGKTTLALQFPFVAAIDLERGMDQYGETLKFYRPPVAPKTVAEMFTMVKWLLTQKHEHSTLVIDPVTILWDMIQTEGMDQLQKVHGADYEMTPKDWKPLNDIFKEFMRLVMLLDMNVIVTARAKPLYSSNEFMKVVGETFDGPKSLPYLFDVEVRLYRLPTGERMAHLVKDRTNKLPTKDFPSTYAAFETCLGKAGLEAKAIPTTVAVAPSPAFFIRATAEQQAEVKRLVAGLGTSILEQKLKAGLPPGPLSADNAVKMIAFLEAATS